MITVRHKLVKARKEHVCNYCSEKVSVGEHYYNSGHIYEGTAYTWKGHVNCSKLLTELNMEGDEGVDQDTFVEYVNNAYYDLIKGELVQARVTTFKERLDFVISKRIKGEKSNI